MNVQNVHHNVKNVNNLQQNVLLVMRLVISNYRVLLARVLTVTSKFWVLRLHVNPVILLVKHAKILQVGVLNVMKILES